MLNKTKFLIRLWYIFYIYNFRIKTVLFYDALFRTRFGKKSKRAARTILEIANQALSESKTLGTSFELMLEKIEYKRDDAWVLNQWMIPTNCHLSCLTSSSACQDCDACASACGNPSIPQPFNPSCIETCYQNVPGCLACDGCKGSCFTDDGYLFNRTRQRFYHSKNIKINRSAYNFYLFQNP